MVLFNKYQLGLLSHPHYSVCKDSGSTTLPSLFQKSPKLGSEFRARTIAFILRPTQNQEPSVSKALFTKSKIYSSWGQASQKHSRAGKGPQKDPESQLPQLRGKQPCMIFDQKVLNSSGNVLREEMFAQGGGVIFFSDVTTKTCPRSSK